MKRFLLMICCAVFLTPVRSVVVDRIVASVQNEAITLSEVMKAYGAMHRRHLQKLAMRDKYLTAVQKKILRPGQLPKQLKEMKDDFDANAMKREALNSLINKIVLKTHAEQKGVRVGPIEITSHIKQQKESMGRERYEDFIAEQGLTETDYREEIRYQMIAMRLMSLKHRKKMVVRDQEVRDFYLKNPKAFSLPPRVRMYIILLKRRPGDPFTAETELERRTRRIKNTITNLDTFQKAARKYSQDKATQNEGGRVRNEFLLDIAVDYGPMMLTAVMKSKRAGLLTAKGRQGSFIIWVDEFVPEKKMTFEQARPRIHTMLLNKKYAELKDRFMARLRENVEIRINEKVLGL